MNKMEEANLIIGLLINNCATLEWLINEEVEQVFESSTVIDDIQRKDVATRWKIIKETVQGSGMGVTEEMLLASNIVDEVIEYYLIHIKQKRDLVAHSPLVSHDDKSPRIESSRRYKENGQNDLEMIDIVTVLGEFKPLIEKLAPAFRRIHRTQWRKATRRG